MFDVTLPRYDDLVTAHSAAVAKSEHSQVSWNTALLFYRGGPIFNLCYWWGNMEPRCWNLERMLPCCKYYEADNEIILLYIILYCHSFVQESVAS